MNLRHDASAPFIEHVAALRQVVFRSIGVLLVSSIIIHTWREPIIRFLLQPLGTEPPLLQFLSPLDPLFFILKIDFTLGFLISLPLIIYFGWIFLAPATKTPTWKALFIIVVTSVLAFAGASYAYHVVVPIVLDFMNSIVIAGTEPAYTASGYLNFLLSTTILLVFVFQIPLGIVLLSLLRLLDPNSIANNRRYVYIGTLVAAAVITPTTDVITLGLVALPAILVTEIGVFVARLLK